VTARRTLRALTVAALASRSGYPPDDAHDPQRMSHAGRLTDLNGGRFD
jgi:hypothetical protein